jgi:hypothetical protein
VNAVAIGIGEDDLPGEVADLWLPAYVDAASGSLTVDGESIAAREVQRHTVRRRQATSSTSAGRDLYRKAIHPALVGCCWRLVAGCWAVVLPPDRIRGIRMRGNDLGSFERVIIAVKQ